MKGVVLAGGLGSRFHPVTKVVNKHLLDVFDRPMIFYPIQTLAQAGVTDLVLVTGKEIQQFKELLGDGSELGVKLEYAHQEGERGIADALLRAEPLVRNEPVTVILGDNIYQEDLTPFVSRFAADPRGGRILLKRTSYEDAKRFGVAEVSGSQITEIVEKPRDPASDLVVTGCYMYDSRVFEIIKQLKPSDRNEYEITDVNNAYIARSEMMFDVLAGWWTDAGTPPSKLKASILVALNQGVTFYA